MATASQATNNGDSDVSTHLAIFTQPFLDLLLDGKKTIESRFAKVKCAPHGCINKGDRVLCKVSGGPIIGEFKAGNVLSFMELTDAQLEEIARTYSTHICSDVDPNFWDARKGKKYATLIFVESPKRLAQPQPFHKRDKRGWVVLKHYHKSSYLNTLDTPSPKIASGASILPRFSLS